MGWVGDIPITYIQLAGAGSIGRALGGVGWGGGWVGDIPTTYIQLPGAGSMTKINL